MVVALYLDRDSPSDYDLGIWILPASQHTVARIFSTGHGDKKLQY